MKNLFLRIMVMGLILIGGIGLVSASSMPLDLKTQQYPSHFDNMTYNTGSNSLFFNGTLESTEKSNIKPISGGLVRLVIFFQPRYLFHSRVIYNETCVTNKKGVFQFNKTGISLFPGTYTAILSYGGNSTYGPCQNTTNIRI